MTPALVLAHYQYGLTPHEFVAQVSGTRVTAILDSILWPSGLRSIDAGLSTLSATGSQSGTSALAALQNAADAELGNVFIDGSGKFVFKDRSKRNSGASVATFGDGAGEQPYEGDLRVDFDDTYIYNSAQVSQAGSSPTVTSVAYDASSVTTYGLRVLSRTVSLSSTADVAGQAATLLTRYKQPVARLSTLSVELKGRPAGIATALGREIGELITVKRRPIGGTTISLDCWIDGVEDKVSPSGWTRTFLLTPKFANSTY